MVIWIGVLALIMAVVLLLDTGLSALEKRERMQRMRKDNQEMVARIRTQTAQIRRLESKLNCRHFQVYSNVEIRAAELEVEVNRLKRELKVKDELLRAMEAKYEPFKSGDF